MIRKEWVNILALVLFVVTAFLFNANAHLDAGNVVTSYDPDSVIPIPTSTGGVFAIIWLLPLCALGLYALIIILSLMAVYKPHLDRFFDRFFGFKLMMIMLLYAIYLSLFISNQNIPSAGSPLFDPFFLLVITIALSFWYLGHLFDHLKSDYFAPWIKGRSVVWEDTHHVGTWVFYICAGVVLISLFYPSMFILFVSIPLVCIVLMIIAYIYLIFTQEHKVHVVGKRAKTK